MVKCTKTQIRRLKTALRWKGHPEQRQRIQMVLLRESGMTQPAIAEAMGVSLSTMNRAHMAYDHGGLKALRRKPSGGRKRENMTLAEEKVLLTGFAKAAGAGELLNIHDLKVDGAGNHHGDELEIPDNIILHLLPPYSPELNPQENLWGEIREKIFKNYALKSMDDVNAKLDEAAFYIERNPTLVRSITSFPYIAKSL